MMAGVRKSSSCPHGRLTRSEEAVAAAIGRHVGRQGLLDFALDAGSLESITRLAPAMVA